MCHGVPGRVLNSARFDSVLLSVLSKPSRTLSLKHTQTANSLNDLHVCRMREFADRFG